MEELAKETLWGRTLVETVQELVAAGKIHPHLAKNVMYVLENKPDLSFLSKLQINASELVQYRRRGRVLEVRLQDVSLDRVFNHAWSNYKSYEILSKFAQVTHLTIFAFDCHQEKDTEAYLCVLSQLLDTGLGKEISKTRQFFKSLNLADVSRLKEQFLQHMKTEHETPPKKSSCRVKHRQVPRKIPEKVSMQQPSLNAMDVMTELEHVTSFEDMSCFRKHQKGKKGRPTKISARRPPLDAVDLKMHPGHATPFEGVPCLRKHQKGKRRKPKKVSTHQPPLGAVESVTDSMISPRRPLLLIRRPRGWPVRSPRHTAQSTAHDYVGNIGRRTQSRGRDLDSGDGVISPQNAPAEESVQEAEAIGKGSMGTVKASRRRQKRPIMGRGTPLPRDTPETLQEMSQVSQRMSGAVKLGDAARDPGETSEDKEPVNSCSDGMMT